MTSLLILTALTLQTPTTLTYAVEAPGLTGTAVTKESFLRDGSKRVYVTMSLQSAGGAVTVLQESVYSDSGRPVRKLQRVSDGSGGLRSSTTATFGANGVEIKTEAKGAAPSVTTMAYPAGSIEVKPEFWFRTIEPKRGQAYKYMRLDLGSGEFVETTATYVGRLEISSLGEKVMAHYVRMDSAQGQVKSYFDDEGALLAVESPQMTMRLKGIPLSLLGERG